jgi:CIC family chloride channel protein
MQPAVGGLVVGLMGWFMPEVLGVGYDFVDRVLAGDVAIRTVAILAVLKIIATPMCYSSGNAGGIFGPSLFIGAMIGGATGGVAHNLLPAFTANPGAYALVGMGTAFAGIVRTPLTSVIMIFEMTRDYSIIVPLMISNLISFAISRQLQREPIYEALALQEGVYLPGADEREELGVVRAGEIMTQESMLSFSTSLEEARDLLDREGCNSWPVGDQDQVSAVITRRQIESVGPGVGGLEYGKISDVIGTDGEYAFVHPDQAASWALERMRDAGLDVLPVVSRANIRKLLGIVTLGRILESYGVSGRRSV